jgi:hypothetical protein
MSADEIHVGDIGTVFLATVEDGTTAVDVSTATVKNFVFGKPTGVSVTKAASFNTTGVDGKLKYTTLLGDLDVAGQWKLQVYLEMLTGKWHSDMYTFMVFDNL